MVRSLQCVVTGKVQGVMFRSWVHDQARNLGVNGWIRNLADGTVEVLAQGDEESINTLKRRLLAGPPLSRVDNVQCKWIDYDKEHQGFQIRS
nr:acylphosphatase [Desulfobaculum xiamenense]